MTRSKQTKLDAALHQRKTARKGSKYQPSYAVRYGLRICARKDASGDVESVACRFCTVFGKEDNSVNLEGQPTPRKKTTNPKTWASFRTDLFEKHLRGQHPSKWAEYTALATDMDREAFFKTSGVPYAETLQASFELEESLQFTIQRPIVEVIIGLLFHVDGQLGVSYERTMVIFEKKEGVFVVEEKRPSRFRLCVEFMSAGVTFRMAAKSCKLPRTRLVYPDLEDATLL